MPINLDLTFSGISDAGLASIPETVESLILQSTTVGDASVASLKRLPKLSGLDLRGTAVTDAVMKDLEEFVALRRLDVTNTAITPAAVARLQKKRADIQVWT
jgi:hypothetical protein